MAMAEPLEHRRCRQVTFLADPLEDLPVLPGVAVLMSAPDVEAVAPLQPIGRDDLKVETDGNHRNLGHSTPARRGRPIGSWLYAFGRDRWLEETGTSSP